MRVSVLENVFSLRCQSTVRGSVEIFTGGRDWNETEVWAGDNDLGVITGDTPQEAHRGCEGNP